MKRFETIGTVKAVLANPAADWGRVRNAARGSARYAFRDLKVDWELYNNEDYLFTHDTIVASVATEADGYTIKPGCWDLVNANGNAWTNAVLKSCYKTFIGGENYCDHLQVPSLSKGKILDAVLREVDHGGEKIWVCDILVATSRRHKSLVERIERGELNTMSMGATANFVQCSICGKIFDTRKEERLCEHLARNLGEEIDYGGKKKKCAELCGAIDPATGEYIPDSCVFIEASWVEQPAFEGAVTNYIVETPQVAAARKERGDLESAFRAALVPALRVADRPSRFAIGELRRADKIARIAREALD